MFRYYLPKGTKGAGLILYGPSTAGECITISRFGESPKTQFPTNFEPFINPTEYPDIFPTNQYPDARILGIGKSIAQLKQYDWYSMNAGGHIAVLENASDSLAEGGWLYVKFKSYDGSKISVHSYVWTATESIYKSWYASEAQYDKYNDPIN